MRYLTLEEVIYIYSEVIQRIGGIPGINDEEALEAILAKPLVTFEGEELYPDIFTKVAILLYAMISSKPFSSANSQTALLCALFILRCNGFAIIATQDSIVELVQGTESGRHTIDYIVGWFRRNVVSA